MLVFDTESSAPEAFAGLTALQHAAPRRALVLGGALGGVARELAAYVAGTVDNVEPNRQAFELVQRHVPGGGGPEAAPVRVIFDDPRRFLRDRRPEGYDLILIATAEPTSGETSRFYTREFFGLCRLALRAGGVLGLRLPAAENFWTSALADRTSSIYRALTAEFGGVVVLPGQTLFLFASGASLPANPGVLSARLQARAAQSHLLTPAFIHYLYTTDRRGEVARLLEASAAPANTDARPVCYGYTTTLWLSKFYPGLASALADARVGRQVAGGRLGRRRRRAWAACCS